MEKKYEIPESEEIMVQVEASILSGESTGGVDDIGGSDDPTPQP